MNITEQQQPAPNYGDPQAEIQAMRDELQKVCQQRDAWAMQCDKRGVTAMREAIKEAYGALRELRSFYIETTNLPPCAANAALAKLQPFLK